MKRGLGTQLRHLLELLDGDVEQLYREAGMNYRPRFTPIVRGLEELGPSTIKKLAEHSGFTHSAVSQTVSEMKQQKLLRSSPGKDARERVITLAPLAMRLMPSLRVQWAATTAAAEELNRELSTALSGLVEEAIAALKRRPFRERIRKHLKRNSCGAKA